MKVVTRLAIFSLLCALSLGNAIAQKKAPARKPAAAASAMNANPKIQFTEHKLKNGLRVILAEDHSAPVISIAVNYDVGSRNERPGRTGFAHLFEHMMFQGSANIGKSEHFILIQNNGGTMNGTTNTDRTIYYETLPANQLDLLLFLEADRMKSLDISKENLDNQRNAVQEERRLGIDNQAYGKGFEQFESTIFDNFAYKHSVIGSMEDLNAASVQDVSDFFQTYYAPNNAVLALVGDFDSKVALAKIKEQFESIPAQPAPPKVDVTEPPQTAERRLAIEDPLAQLPLLLIGYKGNYFNTPDAEALTVLETILTGGRSSRLYQALVKDRQLAVQLQGNVDLSRRGASFIQLIAVAAPGQKAADIETVIYEEIGKLQNTPVADWELEKAKTSFRTDFIRGKQSSLNIAQTLAETAIAYGTPKIVNDALNKVDAVTKEDVMRVAKKYFAPQSRTVAVISPAAKK